MMATAVESIPEELVVDLDLFDPALTAGPDTFQRRAAELAEKGPVLYSKAHGGHWIITRYADARRILQDSQTFSSFPNGIARKAATDPLLPLEADPPEHNSYRHAIQPLFSPKRMKALEPEVRRVVTELIDGFIERGECEFVSEFARELPTRVFLAQMGLPYADAPRFAEWTHTSLVGDPDGTEEESAATRERAEQEMGAYFMGVIEERRGQPVDQASDVTSVVINTPVELGGEERLMTDDELLRLFLLTMLGGLHTVQGSLAWGILHLSRNPHARQELVENPDLIATAVEEILRIEAAVAAGRRATRDVEIGGVQMKEGDQLVILFATANRDPAQFEDPESLSLHRPHHRHLSFSVGRHRCIGSHLAREELRVAFEEIHARLPDYEIAGRTAWHPSQTRGVLAMPIRFTPGPQSGAQTDSQ
jgi:cytochrome P450